MGDVARCVGVAAVCGLFLLLPLAGSAAAVTCGGKQATIVGTPGDDLIVGKRASDVIYGGGGDDRIVGGLNGNDRICGGPGDDELVGGRGYDALYGEAGDDRLEGETGADRLDGGAGDDELRGEKGPDRMLGGPGDDLLVGERGSDEAEGGGGDDRISGEKGNDRLEGGTGNDTLDGGAGDEPVLEGGPGSDTVIGGTGIDHADGGPGDGDVVRGDSGIDYLSGGEGDRDIVSYASATRQGVVVDLETGRAKGDGHDALSGFEDVVGSPQGDELEGDSAANRLDGGVGDDALDGDGGTDEAFGGAGSDECEQFSVEYSCGPEPESHGDSAYATLDQGLDGISFVVQGGPGPDSLTVGFEEGAWTVTDSGPLFAGEGCLATGADSVSCPSPLATELLVVTGGNGNDAIEIGSTVPVTTKARVNGNAGSDRLFGGPGEDVLEAGENYNGPDDGHDELVGNGGGDVLYADPGADRLLGGSGNDLLVSSVPTCQGHTFSGGSGDDTVSYGRSNAAMRIEIGGTGGPPGCATPDQIGADNESLEGSDGPDVLIGDSGDNSFLGHLGADTFLGRGGDDFVDAVDGAADRMIACGPGEGDEVIRDRVDPTPTSC
ncbi:MAG TPA: calcium-binding protein [Solirubrobacterales bacterium]